MNKGQVQEPGVSRFAGAFNGQRAKGVMEAVRDMSDWNNRRAKLPKGTGLGTAFQFAHAGYVLHADSHVLGLTPTGRATVRLLDMNGIPQLNLRQELVAQRKFGLD